MLQMEERGGRLRIAEEKSIMKSDEKPNKL